MIQRKDNCNYVDIFNNSTLDMRPNYVKFLSCLLTIENNEKHDRETYKIKQGVLVWIVCTSFREINLIEILLHYSSCPFPFLGGILLKLAYLNSTNIAFLLFFQRILFSIWNSIHTNSQDKKVIFLHLLNIILNMFIKICLFVCTI